MLNLLTIYTEVKHENGIGSPLRRPSGKNMIIKRPDALLHSPCVCLLETAESIIFVLILNKKVLVFIALIRNGTIF